MNKPNPTDTLNSKITLLEQKRNQHFTDLKQQLRDTGESMKPANLIKGAIRDLTTSKQLKSMLIQAAIGFAAGYVLKKIITKNKDNAKNRMIGNALQYGLSFLASKRNNMLKAAGLYVANHFMEAYKQRRHERQLLKQGEPLPETT